MGGRVVFQQQIFMGHQSFDTQKSKNIKRLKVMLKKYDNVRKTIKMSVYLIVEGGG